MIMAMASIKMMFPCKKPRRSHRLELKEKTDGLSKTINDGPLGYFDILPMEVKFLVFTYLPVDDLSVMTITSKAMRNQVELYKKTGWAEQHLLPEPILHIVLPANQQQNFTKQFHKLGLLMKRSTFLYTTKDRLKLIQQFLQKYLCSLHKCCEHPTRCIALFCYGQFLHTVIAGWDDKECIRTFETVGENTLMLRHLNNIVNYKAGAYPTLELQVRLFFRRVFLSQCTNATDKAFWLGLILKPFPMVHQARIMFLLFGPMAGDEIQWYEMCESTPASKEQASICFGDLANAFSVLHGSSKNWSEDDIISVMDELTTFPDEWLAENLANLLYLCGSKITLSILNSKAINGRITELASIVTSMCLVSIRQENSISWVINIVNGVCVVLDKSRDKLNFLYSIADMFREAILDIHEFGDGDDESGQEIQYMLDAQTEFTKEVILMAFRNMLPT